VYTINRNDTPGYQNKKSNSYYHKTQGKSHEPEKAHNNHHKKGGTPTKRRRKRK
jgi:hypothetical protein